MKKKKLVRIEISEHNLKAIILSLSLWKGIEDTSGRKEDKALTELIKALEKILK